MRHPTTTWSGRPATLRGLPRRLELWAEANDDEVLLKRLRPKQADLPVTPPDTDVPENERPQTFWASWKILRRAGLAVSVDLTEEGRRAGGHHPAPRGRRRCHVRDRPVHGPRRLRRGSAAATGYADKRHRWIGRPCSSHCPGPARPAPATARHDRPVGQPGPRPRAHRTRRRPTATGRGRRRPPGATELVGAGRVAGAVGARRAGPVGAVRRVGVRAARVLARGVLDAAGPVPDAARRRPAVRRTPADAARLRRRRE